MLFEDGLPRLRVALHGTLGEQLSIGTAICRLIGSHLWFAHSGFTVRMAPGARKVTGASELALAQAPGASELALAQAPGAGAAAAILTKDERREEPDPLSGARPYLRDLVP